MNTQQIAFLIVLIFLSAFASASETAFFSLDRFQLRRIRERFATSYERIRKLLARPSQLLVLILLLNECVNLILSGLITTIIEKNDNMLFSSLQAFLTKLSPHFKKLFLPHNEWVLTTFLTLVITLPILLLLCEITPKVIAVKMNRFVAITNSSFLLLLYRLFFPILWILNFAIEFALRKLKGSSQEPLEKASAVLSEEDVVILMEEGLREGSLYSDERKLIKKVLELDNRHIHEIMTPITQAFCVSSLAPVGDILGEMRAQKFSRIPVYQRSRRNIVGILYAKDLLTLQNHPELKEIEVRSLMTPAIYVHPEMRLSQLFRKFKEDKTHMAIAVDQAEQAMGVVTLEDVLESIFGEIEDERDVEA